MAPSAARVDTKGVSVITSSSSRSSTSSLPSPSDGSNEKDKSSLDDKRYDSARDRAEGLRPIQSRQSGTKVLSRYATGLSTRTGVSVATTTDPEFEVDFEENDPSNPLDWPLWYRSLIIFMVSYSTLAVVMYSTSYTSAIPGIKSAFGISSNTLPVLGITTYMCGLALGSIVLAPLSEMYGRRPIYIVSMALFSILTIPCALAHNLETILIVRFFGAICGSALISNSPGSVNDIILEEHRALAFSLWSIGPLNGPTVGPLVMGFVFEYIGWRWTNWIVCMASGVGFVMLCCIRETYAPAILRKQAERKRRETGDKRWFSRYDDKVEFWELLRINLSRPIKMAYKEPICIFWNFYIALIYAILYLCFVAYPIVFSQLRGWSPGLTGLSYVGIGTGSLICIACEPLIRRMIASHKADPETGKPPPESMVSIVCVGAICVPVGEIIFAWTCRPNVHWIAPILAGVPFGFGNTAVFIYSCNYLTHSYGFYAASALAGNGVMRSLMGGTLPLAGPSLYRALGPQWAGSLLALLELLCIPIPFVFYRYGAKIRRKSALIRSMQEDKERIEARKRKAVQIQQRAAMRANPVGADEKAAADGVVNTVTSELMDEKLERAVSESRWTG